MKFSVCIPNYNYGRFIERTLRSVLQQTYDNFEIIVSDNASTDDSVAVIQGINDPRIQLHVNRCNVGFPGNLDRAARRASGDVLILLSSDDIMRPGALEAYARTFEVLGDEASRSIVSSSCDTIDENDHVTGSIETPGVSTWLDTDVNARLSAELSIQAYRVEATVMLRRCLLRMQNPFNFCSVAYHRALYEEVEGYGANRLFGPDKRFHWHLLGIANEAILLRKSFFGYRIHSQNQLAQQLQSGALKYLLDEYMNTFETEATLLTKAGLTRTDMEIAYVEYDIVRHGLAQLSLGRRAWAKRVWAFGCATYPHHLRCNSRAWALRLLIALGPIGHLIARRIRKHWSSARGTDGMTPRERHHIAMNSNSIATPQ